MPEVDRQGGSRRTFDLVCLLQEAGFTVTFVAQHQVRGSEPYAQLLNERGVKTVARFDGGALDELLHEVPFSLALLTSWQLAELAMPLLRMRSPGTRIAIDSVDLAFVRNARRLFLPHGDGAPGTLHADYGLQVVRELNTYAAADAVLAVSREEALLLERLMGRAVDALVVPDREAPPARVTPRTGRQGMLFVGNFVYPANTDAVEHLCTAILPRLSSELREEHPVSIVGNAASERLQAAVTGVAGVRTVGWVPELAPYLERAAVFVAPLRYGAGTKRKIIEALMAGCPVVTTTVGAEGLDLADGKHLLIADDPAAFAGAVGRLLTDRVLWDRLSRQGRRKIVQTHAPGPIRAQFLAGLGRLLASEARPGAPARIELHETAADRGYQDLVERVREAVCMSLPASASVAVVSKGDEQLLALEGRKAWHFPADDSEGNRGQYPAGSAGAIAELDAARARGADFLVLPATAFWWLDYYAGFKVYLERHHRLVVGRHDTCFVFSLRDEVTA
ncbi:MAG: glycosyltransferase [Candidatus Riflebacteria bacterium]|nr:glycosyltransferase [Candidatus Riflebacteria bacterium]